MLRCRDGSFYVGCSTALENRLGQHQAGEGDGYTASRRPVELVWVQEFHHLDDAIASERQIKGWSRAKKTALINADWTRVSALSRSHQHHGRPGGGASFDTAAAPPAQDDEG